MPKSDVQIKRELLVDELIRYSSLLKKAEPFSNVLTSMYYIILKLEHLETLDRGKDISTINDIYKPFDYFRIKHQIK